MLHQCEVVGNADTEQEDTYVPIQIQSFGVCLQMLLLSLGGALKIYG